MHFRFHRRRASVRHVRHLPGLQHRSYPQLTRRTFGSGEDGSEERAGRGSFGFEKGEEGESEGGPRGMGMKRPCPKGGEGMFELIS